MKNCLAVNIGDNLIIQSGGVDALSYSADGLEELLPQLPPQIVSLRIEHNDISCHAHYVPAAGVFMSYARLDMSVSVPRGSK